MIETHVLRNPDPSKVFEVACDALCVRIEGVLSQDGHHIAYFSEKFNDLNNDILLMIKRLCSDAISSLLVLLSVT